MRLEWDKVGERIYETGVDRGVLYEPTNGVYASGVAWNGLTTVTESPSGAEASPQYADNIKYLNLISAEEFGATIEAFIELRFSGSTDIDEILETVGRLPEVDDVFTTAGDPDALARIRVDDMDHLQDVINKLRKSGKVRGTKTLMVLGRWSRS